MREWEQSVVEWRRSLAEHIGPDPNILDELESHLRDEIDRLVRQGQTPEQAVLSAIHKVGPPEKLAQEFAKVARPWWPIRLVLAGTFLTVAVVLVLLGNRAARDPADLLLLTHVTAVTVGYLLTYGIGALALCGVLRHMFRDLSVGQRTSWTQALTRLTVLAFALTTTGVVLGGIWAHGQWGQFWSWDLREIGGLATLIWQAILLVLVSCCPRKLRWLMCWGLLANVVVTFAWFVAAILGTEGQLHAYGSSGSILPAFLAILITHVVLIGGGMAPSGWLRLRRTAA
jgi:hypothetical protein